MEQCIDPSQIMESFTVIQKVLAVCAYMHSAPRSEQGWRLPPAPPHLGQHSPGLLRPMVTEWRVTVPLLLNHTIIKDQVICRKLWVSSINKFWIENKVHTLYKYVALIQ